MARDKPNEGGGMLPFELLLRAVISVEEEPFCDECFPPLIASKHEQQAPIFIDCYFYILVVSKYRLTLQG